jgi:uncharacterized protein involved in tolerance to divalent cations/ADP-ribose pyrophosphatase YjhB (NUDIX family)
MRDFIVVYVTTGSPAESDRISRALVEERLAACVNRSAPIQSVHRWRGKVEQSQEELLIIKTRRELFSALDRRVRELHSYEVPEIIALPVLEGSAEYLRWLREQVSPAPTSREENIPTVKEVSAGGVIYRKDSDDLEIALIHTRNRWGLPKGHIEEGERVDEAALREVREETGLEGKLVRKLGDIRYSYRDKSQAGEPIRIYKRVFFYLMRYTRGDTRDHDHEVDDVRWFPIAQAMRELRFATERKMVHRAMTMLASRSSERRAPVRGTS